MTELTKRQIKEHQAIGFFKGILLPLLLMIYHYFLIFISFSDYYPELLWFIFLPIPIFAGVIVYLIWRGIRFKKMILKQIAERHYNFDDDFKKLAWGIYYSQNWLVFSGKCAFCRNNIKHGAHKESPYYKGPSTYTIKITTRDDKTYRISTTNSNALQKVKKWLKTNH